MNEDWLEFRDTLWGSSDGRETPIKDLQIDHLVNILNWIIDRPRQYPPDLYGLIVQEAQYRKTIQFAAGEPIPYQADDGRWYLQDPAGDTLEALQWSVYADTVDNPNE